MDVHYVVTQSITLIQAAKEHMNLSQWVEAIGLFEQILQMNPKNVDCMLKCAECYYQLDDKESSQDYINLTLTIDKDCYQAYCLAGKWLWRENKQIQALDQFRKYFQILAVAVSMTQEQKEEHIWENLISLQSSLSSSSSELLFSEFGKILVEMKEFSKLSERCFEQSLLFNQKSQQEEYINASIAKEHLELLRTYDCYGNIEAFQSSLEKYLSLFKETEEQTRLLASGRESIKNKPFPALNTFFKQAINISPNNPSIKYKIASLLPDSAFKEREQLYQEALNALPEMYFCQFQLAKEKLKINSKDEEAFILLNDVTGRAPNHAEALYEQGKILLHIKKEHKSALKMLKKAIRICDQLSGIYIHLGKAYYKQGKLRKAIACFEIGIQKKEYSQQLLSGFKTNMIYGKSLLLMNQPEKALVVFSELENPSDKHSVQFYVSVCKFLLNEDFSQALDKIALAIQKPSTKANALKILLMQFSISSKLEDLRLCIGKINQLLKISSNPTLCALSSETYLNYGQHPAVAMSLVEKGLGNARLFNEDPLNDMYGFEIEKITAKSCLDGDDDYDGIFGCLIQEAKIWFKLDDTEIGISKILKIKPILIDCFERKCLSKNAEVNSVARKLERKRDLLSVDWIFYADFLLIEMYLSQKEYKKAEEVLHEVMNRDAQNRYFRQVAHWRVILQRDQGMISVEDEVIELESNQQFIPSQFRLIQDLYFLKSFEQGRKYLEEFQNGITENYEFFKLAGDLEFDAGSYILAQKYYSAYVKATDHNNIILKKANTLRKMSLVPRKILLDPEILAKLGQSYQINGNLQESMETLKKSLDIFPNSQRALEWIARGFIKSNKYPLAEEKLNKLIRIHESAEIYVLISECRIQENDIEKAKDTLRSAERLSPDNFNVMLSLAKILLKEEAYNESRGYFDRCAKIKEEDVQTLLGIGRCLYKGDKNYNLAELCLKQVMEKNINNKDCFQELLLFYQISNRIPDPDLILRLKQFYEKDTEILYFFGQTFYKAAQQSRSLSFYGPALTIFMNLFQNECYNKRFPHFLAIAQFKIAKILFFNKNWERSLDFLNRYEFKDCFKVAIKDEDFTIKSLKFDDYMLRARLYIQSNYNPNNAIGNLLDKCMKLFPESELPYFTFALYLISLKSNQAWKFYLKGISLIKDVLKYTSEQFVVLRGLYAVHQGDIQKGKQILVSSMYTYKNSQSRLFHLGNIYFQKRDYENAIESYDLCLTQGLNEQMPSFESTPLSEINELQCLQQLAQSQLILKKYSNASANVQKCLIIDNQNLIALRIKAQLLFEQGKLLESISLSEKSLEINVNNPEMQYVNALANLQGGNVFAAISALQKCFQIDSKYPFIQLKLAVVYQQIGRPHPALSYVQQYLANNPDSTSALLRCSKLLGHFKQFEQAYQRINRLFEIFRKNHKGQNHKAHNSGYLKNSNSLKLYSTTNTNKHSIYNILEDPSEFEDSYINLADVFYMQGYVQKQQDLFEEAAVSFTESLNLNPYQYEAKYSLALVYSQLSNYSQEKVLYKQLLRNQNNSPQQQFECTLNLGNAYLNLGKTDKAIKLLSNYCLVNQECSVKIYANLAACYITQKKFKLAIKAIEENALEMDRNHEESLFLAGLAYYEQAKSEIEEDDTKNDANNRLIQLSMNYFEKSIKANLFYIPAQISLATIHQNLGKYSKAVEICQNALKETSHLQINPNIPDLQLFLANCYFKSSDFWEALAILESLAASLKNEKQNKTNQKNYYFYIISCNIQMARVYRQLHDDKKAIDYLKSCLDDYPEQPEYLYELSKLLSQTQISKENHLSDVIEYLQKAARANKNNAACLYSIADCFNHIHQYQLEIDTLNICLELDPPSKQLKIKIYNNLALAYQSLYNLQKALEIFEFAVQISSEANAAKPRSYTSHLHFNLGNLLVCFQKYPEAKQSFEACLLASPQHSQALNNLAAVCIRLGEYSKAAYCLSQCKVLFPEQMQFYKEKLRILVKKGYLTAE